MCSTCTVTAARKIIKNSNPVLRTYLKLVPRDLLFQIKAILVFFASLAPFFTSNPYGRGRKFVAQRSQSSNHMHDVPKDSIYIACTKSPGRILDQQIHPFYHISLFPSDSICSPTENVIGLSLFYRRTKGRHIEAVEGDIFVITDCYVDKQIETNLHESATHCIVRKT